MKNFLRDEELQNLKKAETANPVFVLDEIDLHNWDCQHLWPGLLFVYWQADHSAYDFQLSGVGVLHRHWPAGNCHVPLYIFTWNEH
mgnify:CR=1 FL=1